MTDSIPAPLETTDAPQKLCEKCRHSFPTNQFLADFEGMECVCLRCLKVMGYQWKADQ